MSVDTVMIECDLKERGITNDILDVLSAFPLFVQTIRDGDKEIGPRLLENLIVLFKSADVANSDLRILGSAAPDLFYKQIALLEMMDEHTRNFCKVLVEFLFDRLLARGVKSFYILDNNIREDRFLALVELTKLAGFSVISPCLNSPDKTSLVKLIKSEMAQSHHIFYIEPNSDYNYLETVKTLAKNSGYVVTFRYAVPSEPCVEILSFG